MSQFQVWFINLLRKKLTLFLILSSRASDIIVPSKTAPRISALKKSVDVESQKVITATNTAATGSSKSNNKRIERASKSGVQSKKAINSFTE